MTLGRLLSEAAARFRINAETIFYREDSLENKMIATRAKMLFVLAADKLGFNKERLSSFLYIHPSSIGALQRRAQTDETISRELTIFMNDLINRKLV